MQRKVPPSLLRHITYRGELTSCNYRCPYCAFGCKPASPRQLAADQAALERFCHFISALTFSQPLSILIAPYGEALLHRWYWQAIAALSRHPQLHQICCQTNLSFSADDFLQALGEGNANLEKVALWATFHPSMVQVSEFAQKANSLSAHLSISVGAVGDPAQQTAIEAMRRQLNPSVYLWVNKMDGLARKYTAEEQQFFAAIDPLFCLELSSRKNFSLCSGGSESLFVKADGTAFPCCRSKKTLGNLYQTLTPLEDCGGRCDCFLAYSNRRDLAALCQLGEHPQLRLPTRRRLRAVLFDIDDSVYFASDPEKTRAARAFLTRCHQAGLLLLAATALTRHQAERRLGEIKHLLSGGVFAYGAALSLDAQGFSQLSPFNAPPPQPPLRVFSSNGVAYKLLVRGAPAEWAEYGAVYAEEQVAVVPHGCSKQAGTQVLIHRLGLSSDEIIVLGNSVFDIPLFSLADRSVAVLGAPKAVCAAARWTLPPSAFSSLLDQL